MSDFLFIGGKNKYERGGLGKLRALPYLVNTFYPYTDLSRIEAARFVLHEKLISEPSVLCVAPNAPSDRDLVSFLSDKTLLTDPDLFESAYEKAKIDALVARARKDGTYDNVLPELDDDIGRFLYANREFAHVTRAFEKTIGSSLGALTRKFHFFPSVSKMDSLLFTFYAKSHNPVFEDKNIAFVYTNEHGRAYSVVRKLTVIDEYIGEYQKRIVDAPADKIRREVERRTGSRTQIVHLASLQALNYCSRRDFHENVRLDLR